MWGYPQSNTSSGIIALIHACCFVSSIITSYGRGNRRPSSNVAHLVQYRSLAAGSETTEQLRSIGVQIIAVVQLFRRERFSPIYPRAVVVVGDSIQDTRIVFVGDCPMVAVVPQKNVRTPFDNTGGKRYTREATRETERCREEVTRGIRSTYDQEYWRRRGKANAFFNHPSASA